MTTERPPMILKEAVVRDNVLLLDIWYPRVKEDDGTPIDTVELGLIDVRAADSIRIHFDFERSGWVISQASKFEWDIDEEFDEDWQEVAFVKAWARKEEGES